MNNELHTYLKRAGEEISLTHEERERIRHTLHAYMEMKPLRSPVSSAPMATFGWLFTMRPVAAALVLALFVSSAGISYAAENTLPGDLLYPIKTKVNEPVRGALAVSVSAKTAWAMDVAGERVQEAATLAATGRLSTTTQQELQTNFQEHARIATENIVQQASSSPETSVEAAVRFEARLSEYANVLAQVAAAKNIDVASLTSSVKTERDNIAAIRTHAESHVATDDATHPTAVRMGIAARAQLDTSTDLARTVSQSLSSSSAAIVAAQLDDASNAISAGENFTATRSTPDALGAFRNALSATEKLDVFLQTISAIHARTGLVVGEPQKEQPGTKTRHAKNIVDETSSSTATSTTNASANLSQDIRSSATSSDNTDNSGENASSSAKTHADEEFQMDGPGIRTLPVSVPVHIFR